MEQSDRATLWSSLTSADPGLKRWLAGGNRSASLNQLSRGTSLKGRLQELNGCSVMIATDSQVAAAVALIELDGVARRMILCPPDLSPAHLPSIAGSAGVDAVVSDRAPFDVGSPVRFVECAREVMPAAVDLKRDRETEWILLTSGTSGAPKMVLHSFASLAGAIAPSGASAGEIVWSTFYDIRRYGGLQIFLRALLDGRSMMLSSGGESTAQFIGRAITHGVTHISGTPSHWRRALMSQAAQRMPLRYVRLSGEIADQAILDRLRAGFAGARVVHGFASTEAGVAFEVDDGLAGFPASVIGKPGPVEIVIRDNSLCIRSKRTASRYLGERAEPLMDESGFVDTDDIVERRGDRYYFVGRRGGVVNVGGLKVHPEEVEAAINRHADVQMSLVKARKNPITGALVSADVVLRSGLTPPSAAETEALKREIIETCRHVLATHKVPAEIRFVPSLEVSGAGKLARLNA